MSLISTITPENAQGIVAEVYREINEMFGFVPNAIKLDSINPEHMSRHWNGIKQSLQHTSLSQKLFALIRALISEAQKCEYCIGLNAGLLIQMHEMSQEQIATDIHTLLINRQPIKSTISITLTLVRGSTLFADCEDKAMKRSS